ncbi:MAG: hypothetical protein ACKVTZ_04485 [Bacteroidia bacterium]
MENTPVISSKSELTKPLTLAEITQRKKALWGLIAISSGIDVVMEVFDIGLAVPSMGLSLVIDEILEWFISNYLSGVKIDLKMRNRLIGLLPLPGVTSVSVQALKEIWKLNKLEKELLS